jgi:transcriptional regulator with XRE-family HTH domain
MRAMGEHSARRLLAENLRVLRLLRGWSQEDLAQAARIDRSYVGGIERAQRNVSIDHLERLALAFELTIPDLFKFPDAHTVGERLLANIRLAVEQERVPQHTNPRKRV